MQGRRGGLKDKKSTTKVIICDFVSIYIVIIQ